MIYILLLISSILNAAEQPREWVITPKVSFGTMEEPINIDIPRYKPDSIEYKILQLVLDVENVFPYDTQYESTYLSNIPQVLHSIAAKRNLTYMKISALKKAGKATENEITGFLDSAATTSPTEMDLIKSENANRKDLYEAISKNLKLSTSEQEKTPKLYAQAIKYQKYYALSSEPMFTVQQDTNILTSMASSYKLKTVWDGFISVLNDEKLVLEKTDINLSEGTLSPKYKCTTEERSFLIRLCAIKENKLLNCKNAPTNESLYSYVSNGTLIWIEGAKDKNKTLFLADNANEYEEIRYCKEEPRKFNLLEKLSSKLIAEDPSTKLDLEKAKKQSKNKTNNAKK
ncbi:MAG: hypothetical protein WCQ47_06375 [bacterium]